jgi:hypothetical protein
VVEFQCYAINIYILGGGKGRGFSSMKLLFGAGVICVLAAALLCHSARAEEEDEKDTIQKWRLGVQEILTSVTAGPLGKDFTPKYLGTRSAALVLKKQLARIRGQAASAMIETLGTRVDLCYARRFKDEVISALKQEMVEAGFKVDWDAQSDRWNPRDTRWCFAGRETMVVHLLPANLGGPNELKQDNNPQ